MVHEFFVILTAVVAVSFLLSGVDDFFIDAYYWTRLLFRALFLRGKIRPVRQKVMCSIPEKWTAIWIPAWREHDVINRMLQHAVESINYENYDIFVGTYPNDAPTQKAVDAIHERYPQVRKIVCPNPGPTNKADCLNRVFQGMLLAEEQAGRRYEIVVLHDAEDVLHPLELKLFNWLIPRKDMVQLPVIPLERPMNCWTAGTYLDEFAENHLKDLLVRERLAKVIPSAGVGTAISRVVLDELAEKSRNQIFNIKSLTEDYEFGSKLIFLKRTGILAQFAVTRAQRVIRGWWRKREVILQVRERVAVREFFPDRFSSAVRQKSRWVLGISLQGWKNLGWPGGFWFKYMLYRDRKALFANVVNALGYVAILYWMVCLAIYGWGHVPSLVTAAWVWNIILADTFLMVHRLIQRFIAVTRISGWHQAFLSIPRAIVGNAINFVATTVAIKQFLTAEHTGRQVAWQKTAHVFPDSARLTEHRRRLGDLLLENRLVTLAQLRSALLAQSQGGGKLGQVLIQAGYISEKDLLTVLSRQLGVPLSGVDHRAIDPTWLLKIPRDFAEAWLVLPLRFSAGALEVACADPAMAQLKEKLEGLAGCPVSLRLAGQTELRLEIAAAYPADGYVGHLLGELLVGAGMIKPAQLDQALAVQKISGQKLGEILQDLGFISPDRLAAALRRQEVEREAHAMQRI